MHRTVADDVVHVALQQHVRVQGDVDLGQRGGDVLLGVKVDSAECLLQSSGAGVGEVHVAAVVVGGEVFVGIAIRDELAHQSHDLQLGCLPMGRAGQHQRHQGLIDQDRVGLVDDRDIRVGRDEIRDVGDELVAQDVKADLVDRRVGDVTLVRRAALCAGRLGGDPTHRQTHRLDQWAHPFGVAASQVVIDGHHVDAAPGEGVTGGGDRAGEGLALAGAHFDDVPGHHSQRPE